MATDFDELMPMTAKQLAVRWTELGIPGEPPGFKHALLRGIAWRTQSRSVGGLDADLKRQLRAAVRRAPLPAPKKTARRTNRDAIQLHTGTTLIRTWRGRKHEVAVLDNGKRYSYRDSEYASLSEIAREITGARWSGPRFFGLKKLKGTV